MATIQVLDLVLTEARVVLNSPELQADDNFFEAGGDSLDVLELGTRISDGLAREVPLEVLWDADNLGDLAAKIEAGGWTAEPGTQAADAQAPA